LSTEKNTYGLPQDGRLRAKLRQFFAEQRRAILGFLRTGEVKSDDWDSAGRPLRVHVRLVDVLGRRAENLQQKAGPGDAGIPAAFPPWDDFGLGALELANRIVPRLRIIWDAGLQDMMPKIGLDPNSLTVESPELKDAIQAAALALAESTNETTSLQLDEALKKTRQALLAGNTGATQSFSEITKAINAIFDMASRSRARTIAVTESARGYHQAQETAAIKSGVVSGWKWLLSSDACPLCQTIARRAPYVRLGQSFAVIGDNPVYSQIKFPPAHPRCQCSMVEVLDIDEQPAWHDTLIQPEPEEEDIATQDLIPVVGRRRKAMPLPRAKSLPRKFKREAKTP
jgi:hypothetical protein